MRRRDFLIRFCQGAGSTLIPSSLWGLPLAGFQSHPEQHEPSGFHLNPHYRSERPLDAALLKVQSGSDDFVAEKYADRIGAALAEWGDALKRSPHGWQAVAKFFAKDVTLPSLRPTQSRVVRSDATLQLRRNQFLSYAALSVSTFTKEWSESFAGFSEIVTAEFQITSIDVSESSSPGEPLGVQTRVRYEIVGTGQGFHREQRVGHWEIGWQLWPSGELNLRSWKMLDETQAHSSSPVYVDISAAVLGSNASYSFQLLHGADYWRTVLDGACGVDIYGHNGVSVADIDGDGFDDLYLCQPAGLPNRLYRNRGDGTFDDITESSGLGILENTACALFADFRNLGRQDVIVVRANGPLLFLNDGHGKFLERPNAFQFTNPPQGTFTGAAVADYDRDGWLDVYFCLYAFYQGTGQYKYPSPYHDAENGPPNFLMRNQRDGTFHDATAVAGLNQNNARYSFCCAWSDYDRDGWPDLYVVNDFGRKNLCHNNRDGTFTDVAPLEKVEDIGAGMSVSWLDYDNDGGADLYVANMWTAAGERISMQEKFKKTSARDVRAQYHKHAMGNSLLRNAGSSFEDRTQIADVGMGRWAWSSDAFDFDHDGFLDLYVTNGMVSGPQRNDLNSFFWRQVVALSPDDARADHDYEQGWNAINELIRSDGTWSGYERNVFYANNRDGTFSDISAVIGLDFVEDGRSFAVADFDHDGRLEVFLKNRNAPQVRILKNVMRELPPSIAFRLQGTKSNRDAIGASVTVETSAGRQTRWLQAGSGFLSQHGKELFFGLGDAKGPVRASILWPSGALQELHDLPMNHRVWVTEGVESAKVKPFKAASVAASPQPPSPPEADTLPTTVETWLLAPMAAPEFSLPDSSGQVRSLSSFQGKPVLLTLLNPESKAPDPHTQAILKNSARWSSQGLQVIVLDLSAKPGQIDSQVQYQSFVALHGSDDFAAIYNILFRQMFDRHRDLILPTSFLIDSKGDIVKVYQGPIVANHLESDFHSIPASDSERVARALPFSGRTKTFDFGRNYLSYGALFFQRGYLEQAEASFQQALRDDPASAEALYGIGSVYLNQNKNAAAREIFERVVKLSPNYPNTLPDAWNNLGVLATREGRMSDAVQGFQQALRVSPHSLMALNNLGNAFRAQQRWDDAREVLEDALAIAPQDPEANYSLGMVFAQQGDNARAYDHLQRALKARPGFPEALNNLGVLYLMTERRDDAVGSFEQCIRVAPSFDQAYLNLARVYAMEGAQDKARGILAELLKQHPDHQQAQQMLGQMK